MSRGQYNIIMDLVGTVETPGSDVQVSLTTNVSVTSASCLCVIHSQADCSVP